MKQNPGWKEEAGAGRKRLAIKAGEKESHGFNAAQGLPVIKPAAGGGDKRGDSGRGLPAGTAGMGLREWGYGELIGIG